MASWQPTATLYLEMGTTSRVYMIIGKMLKIHIDGDTDDRLESYDTFTAALRAASTDLTNFIQAIETPKEST